ncbi:polar amino acid transport system substrate-binding protein [Ectopseudomonas alcaliphila]|uniref:Polar amino acid transport system substrate-binding protein n=1 Tax=Ectopseudomonas alcaliphila TaxID=101564 RepID=A0A1G7KE87_9GAMM|nr:polar amino acid transport system substrate-binding protein [Pseudomonas alcaliphila]
MRLQHCHSVYACRATLIRVALEQHSVPQVEPVKHSTLIAALLCLLFGALARAETYQLVTEEWAPYNYSEDGRITGMATDVVRAIMALTGDDFEIRLRPSMRATRTLRTQPRTIMFSMFRTPERELLYKWVGPIAEESIYPYQLATAVQPINTLEQLLHAPRITTRHAGLVPTMLQSLGFNNLDKSATESPQLYRMLLAGRTEIIIGDTDAGVAYYSRQLGIAPGTLRRIPIELYRSSLYIAFSLDSDDALVATWAAALEQLRTTGELERMQSRYRQPARP